MRQVSVGHFETTPRMRELVNLVLDTGRLSYGPLSQQFESQFAAIHGSSFGVLSNSGTSSLQVALQALKECHGWADGDEVIVPSVTFVATVNIVLHNRLTPVLVDVEPDYYGLDPDLVEAAITPRTRAIIPVHLFGMPCSIERLCLIAEAHGLKVLEDSCECMFARYKDRYAGTWGDIGCYSTYIAHLLTAGVGGLALTDDPELAVVMRSLVNHGRDSIYLSIDDDKQYRQEVVARRFRFERFGHSFRVTELEAALALAQLETWPEMIHCRQLNAGYLAGRLCRWGDRLQMLEARPHADRVFMMFPIVLRNESKDALVAHLEQAGIETRDMLPLVNQPVYQTLFSPEKYPVAQWIDKSGFYIGSHTGLAKDDLDYVIEKVGEYFGRSAHS